MKVISSAVMLLLMVAAVFTTTVTTTQAQAIATEYDAFVEAELRTEHFSETLLSLIEKETILGAEYLINELFGERVHSVRDSKVNAQALRKHFSQVSEFAAGAKFDSLRMALLGSGKVNESAVLRVEGFALRVLAPHFWTNVAQLDDSSIRRLVGSTPNSNKRRFRHLVLGLNALIVERLRSKATRAVFRMNHLAAVDPVEFHSFKGLIPAILPTPPPSESPSSSPTIEPTVDPETPPAAEQESSEQEEGQQGRRLQTATVSGFLDWVGAGAVPPVQNQGNCGACWIFSATAVMASRLVATGQGNLTVLSQQQVLSCSNNPYCSGGNYEMAWDYASQVGGITSSENYPYEAGSNTSPQMCNEPEASQAVIDTVSTVGPPVFTEQSLAVALGTGPVSIGIATPSCFNYYSSGILTNEDCGGSCYNGPNSLDHAVTLVGYGTDPDTGMGYWKIQNSWGPNWGVQGYVYFAQGVTYPGMCGMLTMPAYPTSVSQSAQCSVESPPSYCDPLQQQRFTSVNGTNDIPGQCYENPAGEYASSDCDPQNPFDPDANQGLQAWEWALIGIAIAIGVLIILRVTCVLCYRAQANNAAQQQFTNQKGMSGGYPPVPKGGNPAYPGMVPQQAASTTAVQI